MMQSPKDKLIEESNQEKEVVQITTCPDWVSPLFNEVVDFVSKDLDIEPKIKFFKEESSTFGVYQGFCGTVYLNLHYLEEYKSPRSLFNFVNTIGHELRHSYQDQYNPLIMEDYVNPRQDQDAYYNHPCEVDARAYGEYVADVFIDKVKEASMQFVLPGTDIDGDL